MPELTRNAVFDLYALCSAVLVLHLVALALWTGTIRTMRRKWVNPEDARFNRGIAVDVEDPAVGRARRAHLNALENAVPFFVIGLLYALTGGTAAGAKAYFFTFTGARLLHSIFYLWGRQPFRTLAFAVGVLALVGLSVQVLLAAVA